MQHSNEEYIVTVSVDERGNLVYRAVMFYAEYEKARGWRIRFAMDGAVQVVDICGALNETVARDTATELNRYRAAHP